MNSKAADRNEGEGSDADDRRDPLLVAAIVRAFSVVESIADAPSPPTLAEAAQASGMTFQSVQRIANAMVEAGYLDRDERRKTFRFSQRTLDLQYTYLRTNNLLKAAWPVLMTLREQTGLHISLCVLDGTDIVYLLRLASNLKDFKTLLIGRRRPAALSSGGLAILSARQADDRAGIVERSDLTPLTPYSVTAPPAILSRLEKIAQEGFVIEEQEIRAGEISAAVPLSPIMGAVSHALVAVGSMETHSPQSMRREIVPLLQNAAVALERL